MSRAPLPTSGRLRTKGSVRPACLRPPSTPRLLQSEPQVLPGPRGAGTRTPRTKAPAATERPAHSPRPPSSYRLCFVLQLSKIVFPSWADCSFSRGGGGGSQKWEGGVQGEGLARPRAERSRRLEPREFPGGFGLRLAGRLAEGAGPGRSCWRIRFSS